MVTKKKRVRSTQVGFVGANLAGADGDLTLYNRLVAEKKATTMSQSLILRLALQEYFDKRDNKSE
jgi:hypothetical protein